MAPGERSSGAGGGELGAGGGELGAGGGGPVHEVSGDHYRDHFHELQPQLRGHLAPHGALNHIAQCSDGVLDFGLTVDVGPDLVEAMSDVDQRLAFTVAQLDTRLAPVRTGDLIRLVAQTPAGAYQCYSVVPGVYLLGAVLTRHEPTADAYPRGQAGVDLADRDVADVTRIIRDRLSLGSRNQGAFDEPEAGPRGAQDDRPAVTVHGADAHSAPLVDALRGALATDGVHYLAYHHAGRRVLSVDMFEDPALSHFFSFIRPNARRAFYHDLGLEFEPLVADLSRIVRWVVDGQLTRVVLDVEQGAIYYFRVRPAEYLVGVTLRQRSVRLADMAIDRLVTSLLEMGLAEAA